MGESAPVVGKARNTMYDAVKGIAILSVLFSHTYKGGTDPVSIFVREIAMWCVPVFFLLQGYFMYSPKPKKWIPSTWKKIKKAYIPYLIWAFAYGFFYLYMNGKTFTLEDIILGKTALHLYFMFHYMLFAIFLPLLYFVPAIVRKYAIYFMMISNIAIIFINEISKTYHVAIIHYSGPMPVKWWGFVALGMLVAEYPAIINYLKEKKSLALGLSVAAFIIGLGEPFVAGTVGYLFNKVALIPLALGLYGLLALYYQREDAFLKKQFVYIGERTFGIYLPHFMMLYFLKIYMPSMHLLTIAIMLAACLLLTDGKNYIESRLFPAKKTASAK